MSLSRRELVAGAAATAVTATTANAAAPRVVALDWALASTLVSMGCVPVGMGEPDLYRRWVAEPAIPDHVADIGLRVQPNLERTAALRPDLILIGPLSEPARPVLEPIAPVAQYNAFTPARRPLAKARRITRELGRRVGCDAEALLGRAEAAFDEARARLAGAAARRILLVSLLDERHLNVYGRGSLFGDVLDRLGLVNGWDRPATIWGTSATGIEAIAEAPDADLVLLEPVPPGAGRILDRPGLWHNLMALRSGRMMILPPAWMFGDVVAASRFATLLARAYRPDA